MAQLFFRYGTMNSGKSLQLLAVKHNYEEKGSRVLLLTSALDDRAGVGIVKTRLGIKSEAIALKSSDNILDIITDHKYYDKGKLDCDCVLVDEAEFLTPDQIEQLWSVVVHCDTPVICYGLKTDFTGHLFDGSKRLLELADKIEEIKTVCEKCDRKATMNLRTIDGKAVYEGDQVQIGDSEYHAVCSYHHANWEE